jgi:hypothetical protein
VSGWRHEWWSSLVDDRRWTMDDGRRITHKDTEKHKGRRDIYGFTAEAQWAQRFLALRKALYSRITHHVSQSIVHRLSSRIVGYQAVWV